jgi:hypothetical protein
MSTAASHLASLIDGERLTRDEFLRRYEAMPHVKKAELIGGIVRMPSPVSRAHGTRDIRLGTWLQVYAAYTPGCEAASNSTWLMLGDAPQPDCDLRVLPEYGGESGAEGSYAAGAPELIAETSQSSVSIDLTEKKKLYRAAGVGEYLVLLIPKKELRWFRLASTGYKRAIVPADGILRSQMFPGLWLHVSALISGDMAKVLETLQQGLSAPEHAAFVRRLARRQADNSKGV